VTSPTRDISGYSRAMFSNWCWHEPFQLLIDAGEGLQLALGQKIWTPEVVALTHGHSDHVLGLPGLVASRKFAKGAQERPLTVVFPDGNNGVLAVRELLARMWSLTEFPVTWVPIRAGGEYRLARTRVLQAFATSHGGSEPTQGYAVLEERRRLRPEYAGLSEREIRARVREGGRDQLTEAYRHIRFAHTGDAMPVDPAVVAGADILVHDATFLDAEDRKWDIHATAGEAIDVGRAAGVGCLVLHHLSVRYDRAAALPALRAQVASSGFAGECWLLDEQRLINLK
jgi:ribonuclease Z